MFKSLYEIDRFLVTTSNCVPRQSHYQIIVFETTSVYEPAQGHGWPASNSTYFTPKIYCTAVKEVCEAIVAMLIKADPNRKDFVVSFVKSVADVKVSVVMDMK